MSDQGEVYAAFIEDELTVERDRRTALDARGLAIVTTSGTVTTLLVAVGAFVSGRQGFTLPDETVPTSSPAPCPRSSDSARSAWPCS